MLLFRLDYFLLVGEPFGGRSAVYWGGGRFPYRAIIRLWRMNPIFRCCRIPKGMPAL
ncbi:MAG: hypothetical protein K5920_04880 [Bacteroidales bacterium]|nr:hypothetical protein [Bacteroidales bacterium]